MLSGGQPIGMHAYDDDGPGAAQDFATALQHEQFRPFDVDLYQRGPQLALAAIVIECHGRDDDTPFLVGPHVGRIVALDGQRIAKTEALVQQE